MKAFESRVCFCLINEVHEVLMTLESELGKQTASPFANEVAKAPNKTPEGLVFMHEI